MKHEEMFAEDMTFSMNHVFVNSGMTNSQGLLEIKVKVDSDTAILIQLQGRQYRRCVERKIGTLMENYKWLRECADKRIRDLFLYDGESIRPIRPYPPGLCKNDSPFRKHASSNENRLNGFCKFGNRFIYQYVRIDENVKIGTIIKAVVQDVIYFRSILEGEGPRPAD
ncbi:MAG: hypothetical protein K2M06_02815 [Muribaculaceae bacterium]|nr:hypothetical protein [Muribaculaceae bacterium]